MSLIEYNSLFKISDTLLALKGKEWVLQWIESMPANINNIHYLCFSKLQYYINLCNLQVLLNTPEEIIFKCDYHGILAMEIFMKLNEVKIRDYTFINPPYYECIMHPHLHAPP